MTGQNALDTLDLVIDQLTTTESEIGDMVHAIPPAELGEGRLRGVLEDLVRSSPVPVLVAVDDDAAAGQQVEATLYYVCAEALTNAVKHAGATRITVRIRREGTDLVATVVDDGRGGADPAGSGLTGLADRLATRGGRLRVESPPGAGTSLTAVLPG